MSSAVPTNLSMRRDGVARKFSASLCVLLGLLGPCQSSAEEVTVRWERERCEYLLIQKADGYGLIMQLSGDRLKENDVFESDLTNSINTSRVFTHKATGQTGMLRGIKYELTRKQALREFPQSCKAPKE